MGSVLSQVQRDIVVSAGQDRDVVRDVDWSLGDVPDDVQALENLTSLVSGHHPDLEPRSPQNTGERRADPPPRHHDHEEY